MTPGQPNPAQSQGQPDAGLDVEGQIRDGVEAFVQSQDPAIAVEVVTMLAEMLGIAPNIDPYQGQAPAGAPAGPPAGAPDLSGGAPVAQRGMKMYRIGGRIMQFKSGGSVKKKS